MYMLSCYNKKLDLSYSTTHFLEAIDEVIKLTSNAFKLLFSNPVHKSQTLKFTT